jgi:hypothetical protein
MKFFNTAGPVNKDMHYKIDPLHRWDLEEILQLISQEKYFSLNAPRQTGKTSCMLALQDYLNASGEYNAIYLNVEGAQVARNDVERGIGAIVNNLSRCVNNSVQEIRLVEIVNENKCDDALNAALQYISESSDKPVVLFIDEIDSLVGDTLISVLRQIRASYEKRPDKFPASLVLCGVRDIQDYRIQRSNQDIITGGSCFNIKAESLRLGNFTRDDVHKLLMEHTLETGQKFDDAVADFIFDQTDGQPWLVNAVAYEVTYKMKENRNHAVLITKEMVSTAINRIIVSRAVHLDQLADKLKEDRVRRVILPMILNGNESLSTEDDIQYCIDLGIIKDSGKGLVIANPIYKEIVPRELTSKKQRSFKTVFDPQWINSDGSLNTSMLFELFTDFWRTNSEIWSEGMSGYEEAAPHLVFQAFLQRVANGSGFVRREYALGRKRTDLYLEWRGNQNVDGMDADCNVDSPVNADGVKSSPIKVQKIVIELKMLRKKDNLESIKAKALEQTAEYSKMCNASENHILIFDRDKTTDWREKIFTEKVDYEGMAFTLWGV